MTLASIVLVLISAALLTSNLLDWRRLKVRESDERTQAFAARQLRRRMQTSAMIGLVGIAFFVLKFVHDPLVVAFSWIGVLLLIGWILLLAFGDIVATRVHYGRLRRQVVSEQVRLQTACRNRSAEQREVD